MVFCGKPSTGCSSCRRKRKKCDGVKPACWRCLRTHVICPGYRDIGHLVFRDESSNVVRKANKIQEASIIADQSYLPTKRIEPLDTEQSSITLYNQDQALISCSISSTLEEHATSFFFRTYVTVGWPSSRGQLNFMPLMYGQSQQDDALQIVIKSIGIAGLSTVTKNPQLMMAAKKSYVSALRLTNTMLGSGAKSTSDQMLMTVLLLGLYETVTCSAPESMKSWDNHIKGALILLELRGERQLKHDIGLQMFLILRDQVLLSCLQRGVAVPETVVEWSSKALKYLTEVEKAEDILAQLATRLCAVKGHGSRDPVASIYSLFSIRDDLAKWVEHLLETSDYTKITTDVSRDVLSGYYHIYQDDSSAEVWNNYRCVTILTNELILDHLRALKAAPKNLSVQFPASLQQELESNNLELSSDICATVPFFLELYNSSACGKLVWPLYVAASMYSASDMMRDWVTAQLAQIGHIVGTNEAQTLARMLQTKEDILQWRLKTTGLGEPESV